MKTEELYNTLNGFYTDILITDGLGIITMVAPSFETWYGISEKDIVGKSVYEMETAGVFRPSVTAMVLKNGKPITTTQRTGIGHEVVVSALPIKDERDKIVSVLSYSRDVTELVKLKEEYDKLQIKLSAHEREIEELRGDFSEGRVIAKDRVSASLLRMIGQIAPFDTNVLLLGESGVGKSLFAHLIHEKSERRDGRFVEINCGAIPEALLESELFGYEKGSFTGARKEGKMGLIETADGGTLFLDEITELPLSLQVKLLNVIQSKTVMRVGNTESRHIDFRLVSATNKDIAALTESGLFRNDLYYRLNVVAIEIPPLRERKEDVIPLVAHAAERINRKYGLNKEFSKDTYEALTGYSWHGNVRELENLIERLMITTESHTIRARDLPNYVTDAKDGMATASLSGSGGIHLSEILEDVEKKYYIKAWELAHTTIGVSKILGVSQPTAARKLKKYVAGYATKSYTCCNR